MGGIWLLRSRRFPCRIQKHDVKGTGEESAVTTGVINSQYQPGRAELSALLLNECKFANAKLLRIPMTLILLRNPPDLWFIGHLLPRSSV